MPDHPDYDAAVLWQQAALYSQLSGGVPAVGTTLFSGPVTNVPALLLRALASSGGYQFRVNWYLDAALTQLLGSDSFHNPAGQGTYAVYEVQAPFVKIDVVGNTVAPPGAGSLLIVPTRAVAIGFRPLCTPQTIALPAVSVPANSTSVFLFKFSVFGRVRFIITALGTPGSLQTQIDSLNFDGSTNFVIEPFKVATAPANYEVHANGPPLRLQVQNTTGAAATITGSLVSQQQGW